jgi:phosphoribosylglycinamide formyltransferase 1
LAAKVSQEINNIPTSQFFFLPYLACISADYAKFRITNVIGLSSEFPFKTGPKKGRFQTIFLPHLYRFLDCLNHIIRMELESRPVRLAIFASGQGSNALAIIRFFEGGAVKINGKSVEVALIVCNKKGAGVLDVARSFEIPTLIIEKDRFFNGSHYLEEFRFREISFIVLAGFLWKIPSALVEAFPDRILNIHPALLPAYGGKGMYGKAVHEAVVAAGETESGITIHYVDEQYDHGRILFQARCRLAPDETAESLAGKIHALEHRHYPPQIARWVESKLTLNP